MPAKVHTREAKDEALALYEAGMTSAEVRERTGVANVRDLAHRRRERPVLAPEQLEQRRLAWAERKMNLADEAGTAAAAALERVKGSLKLRQSSDARAYAGTFATLVDKAQLLAGEATQRVEQVTESRLDQRIETLLDEMTRREVAPTASSKQAESSTPPDISLIIEGDEMASRSLSVVPTPASTLKRDFGGSLASESLTLGSTGDSGD